ncbi:enoyl-CoA hydratase/isomerase family protein [Burkholderia multivorans]|uniref:enoyl-CoA hydratase-related protein n=1 Tax=Burkholderia multivorans TaxID=87883 RepID=UPI001C242CD8|nr:enoyl-CoA hydratase-related protein [Burkholderia multivorans]MBU9127185.1 enoyl-CoA hydratase/isomerase family protein [Burkholderia multivorans]
MTAEIHVDLADGILTMTLARPDKKNALTNEMYGRLADVIEHAEHDGQTRVLLVQADGDMFTAGNDVGEFAAIASGKGPSERHVHRFLHALAKSNLPVIAAVQGKAVGIGTTMLLHCDYVLLTPEAELITPFVNLALVPEAASSYLLPLRVGHLRAFEMFALGEPLDAQTAVAWGLANKVCAKEQLRLDARRMAERIAAKPAGSLSATKKLMREAQKLIAQMDSESAKFQERLTSAEAREAFAAFAEKRKPNFSAVTQH